MFSLFIIVLMFGIFISFFLQPRLTGFAFSIPEDNFIEINVLEENIQTEVIESAEISGEKITASNFGLQNDYKIQESLASCTNLSTSGIKYTLTSNINSAGSCINIEANNIILDCTGYFINYSTADRLGYGINNTLGKSNVTVQNCRIYEGNTSTAVKIAIYYANAQNGTVYNNTIITTGGSSYGIYYLTSNFSNISYNFINTSGSDASGIALSGTSNNYISYNIINTTAGYGIQLANSKNDRATYNNITTYTDALDLINTVDSDIISNNKIMMYSGGANIALLEGTITNLTFENNTLNLSTDSPVGITALSLLNVVNSTFRYNIITLSSASVYGIATSSSGSEARDNIFLFNNVLTTGTTSNAIYLLGGTNNTFISDNITTTGVASNDIQLADAANATFVNATFVRTKIGFDAGANGSLSLQWYVTINLSNYVQQGLGGGNITAFNRTFNQVDNSTTNNNGLAVKTFILTEYFRNATAIYPHTPHRINVSVSGYAENFTTINLTAESNPIDFLRTIYIPTSITDIFITSVNNIFAGSSWTLNKGNLTNVSTSRPFISFNVTGTQFSYAVNLSVYNKGGNTAGDTPSNFTVAYNNTNTDIYFNRTLTDGYYTWTLNASNITAFIRTHIFAIIIDTTPPNLSFSSISTAGFKGLAQQQLNFPIDMAGSIFINVSTNDTSSGNAQVGGGFAIFELHNSSGLLNRTISARNIFKEDIVSSPAINLSYKQVADLADGYYQFNVSVNDSLGNSVILTTRNITIDRIYPVPAISSSLGTSFKRQLTTTLICSEADTNSANVTMTLNDNGASCTGSSSCQASYTPIVSGSVIVSCIVTDLAGHASIIQQTLTIENDQSSGGSSSRGGGSGGNNVPNIETNPTEVAGQENQPVDSTTPSDSGEEQQPDIISDFLIGDQAREAAGIDAGFGNEEGEVIAFMRTEKGNEITIRKGNAITIILKSLDGEKVRLKYETVCEKQEYSCLNKPKFDILFNSIKKINLQHKIKYPILVFLQRALIIILIIFLIILNLKYKIYRLFRLKLNTSKS